MKHKNVLVMQSKISLSLKKEFKCQIYLVLILVKSLSIIWTWVPTPQKIRRMCIILKSRRKGVNIYFLKCLSIRYLGMGNLGGICPPCVKVSPPLPVTNASN